MVNFLTSDIFKNLILPFLLVFTLIFAILEKSKLLGDDKHQINAILAAVIAGLFIGFFKYVSMLQSFMVFLVICLIILFVFMMIYGFVAGTKDGNPFKDLKEVRYIIGGIFFIAVVVAVLIITNTWDNVKNFFSNGNVGSNVLFAIIIIGAIAAVVFGAGSGSSSGSSEGK